MKGLIAKWSRNLWPASMRITTGLAEDVCAVLTVLDALETAPVPANGTPVDELEARKEQDLPSAAKAPTDDDCVLTDKQLAEICLQLFRVGRYASQLDADAPSRQSRRIGFSLRALGKVLGDAGVTYHDVTGDVYRPGRLDFEPASAREKPGATEITIETCDIPVVRVHDRIVQKGKGTVVTPPKQA